MVEVLTMIINPRSGHFTLGPSPKDPWYIRVMVWAVVASFVGVVTMMEKIGDAISYISEFFK